MMSMVAKRYFESGLEVTLAENITGDDRIINKAQAGAVQPRKWRGSSRATLEDADKLGLGRPDVEPYATEHIRDH